MSVCRKSPFVQLSDALMREDDLAQQLQNSEREMKTFQEKTRDIFDKEEGITRLFVNVMVPSLPLSSLQLLADSFDS